MSPFRQLFRAGGAGLLLSALNGLAQTNPSVQTQIQPSLQTSTIQRVGQVVVSDQQAVDSAINLKPRPESIDLQKLPPEIKLRIRRFEVFRESYLREQDELRKKLQGAPTEAERQRVRDLIRNRREAWLQQTRALREEMKDRLPVLRERLEGKRELLDGLRDKARDSLPDRRGSENR